ncbi:MAG: AMP-binding protein [Oceanipulchritudo sp.]
METTPRSIAAALPFRPSPVSLPGQGPLPLAASRPHAFWSGLLAAMKAGRPALLMDPAWPEKWGQALEKWVEKWGQALENGYDASLPEGTSFILATSGSSGLPKLCLHDPETLGTAASAFRERFAASGIIHSVVVLPQHHVGGLMPVLRAAASGGKVHFADYRDPRSLAAAPFPLGQASLSVVPTQLKRMRADPSYAPVLKQFGLVLTGGAHSPPDLLQWARRESIRLAPCYGSTETAAMVTVLDPEAFLSGINAAGTPMPHATIRLDARQRVLVDSLSNLRAYLPPQAGFSRTPLPMGDIGEIDAAGQLHILGRADRVINSGGEKIHPEQVEAAAISSGLVSAARCTGVPDPDWGMRAELEVVPHPGSSAIHFPLLEYLRDSLPPYAVPKVLHLVQELPAPAKADFTGPGFSA